MRTSSNMELIIKEGQLTWLVYIIGGVISGRISYNMGNSEEHDLYDGELVVRVLQLMTFINTQLEQTRGSFCCEKLDLAMLNFFEQFRKIFIGDQVQKSSKVNANQKISSELIWFIFKLIKWFNYPEVDQYVNLGHVTCEVVGNLAYKPCKNISKSYFSSFFTRPDFFHRIFWTPPLNQKNFDSVFYFNILLNDLLEFIWVLCS